ncbi:hypothetical protein [Aurantimonas endophytica]|uniref:Uncharacterized protein n=1 Tax=Aurantimonas endophytica TaxID=1522175 RepID=A0A7W6HCB4_9HYPH|nr:hypothetical protein [Aurantimonas endophytica]MBB4002541.1 hypothetical protein [Aurantimonas endophytica]MCO6403422.1 hypothetical protein [Aurantimonas endophytica]
MTGDGFEAILGGMEAAATGPRDEVARVRTGPGFWSVLGAMHAEPTIAREDEDPSDGPPGTDGTVPPPVPPSIDPADIARDLAIRPGLAPAQLKRLRRAFAGANHPDVIPTVFRKQATIRMQVANRLIDEALQAVPQRRHPAA